MMRVSIVPRAEQSSPETLFHHWRRGDESAGKAMAQRFTDWYYAMAVSRLGEADGDAAFRAASSKFSKGVMKVEDPRRLLGWAHQIARKQIHALLEDGRPRKADTPNAFSRRRPPSQLLVEARSHIPEAMSLLERVFRGEAGDEDPLKVLKARYSLKSWLRAHMDVPFRVTPHEPDPDRAPLAYYEAGRMQNESEETLFELYMLADQEICQDVAEFAHFAQSLRHGTDGVAPSAELRPRGRGASLTDELPQESKEPAPEPIASAPREATPTSSSSNVPFIFAAIVSVGLLVAALWASVQWLMHGG